MINLQSNYPVLAEQDREWNRLLHTAVDRFAPESLRLPAFGGSVENRRLAAAWLDTPVERVFIAEAGHHALLASVMAAGLVGKTIAVEMLTYPWFVRQVQMLGCRIVPVEMDGECMRPDALRAVCEREKVAAVYTMPTQHNPTGRVASFARRDAMVEVAREFGLTIIEDAAYGFLVTDEPPRYVALAPERAFYVESLSKRVAPGLRTAFLVAPAQLAAESELALRVTTSGSSTLLASLGCSMAEDGSLAAVIAAKRVEGARRQATALETLAGLVVEGGQNSWHLWVALHGELTAESTEALCEARGVLVTGAHWFTAPGAEVPRAVRVGLGGETEWERVAEGLRVFAEIVR
jgi:DNA-binding transcriptional MocR family regulator